MDNEDGQAGDGLLIMSFVLGQAHFGVDAQLVQEVVKVGEITCVHHAHPYVAGIRNLRGRIVTVVDLAVLLGLGCVMTGPDTRLLLMECEGEPVGFLVDSATEAVLVKEGHLAPPPANLVPEIRRNLRGVWRDGERLIAILDPRSLLQEQDELTVTS